jgi:hypothetical protein
MLFQVDNEYEAMIRAEGPSTTADPSKVIRNEEISELYFNPDILIPE